MNPVSHGKGGISAQLCPSSGMDRTASRTTVPPIFMAQNRHPHRRWRGCFAVPDPARSIPGAAPDLQQSGGDDGPNAAYRRASGRTGVERRSGRDRADYVSAGSGAGRTEAAAKIGLTDIRQASFHAIFLNAQERNRAEDEALSEGRSVRQDQRNGAMPHRHSVITSCLHIVFRNAADGAIAGLMVPPMTHPVEIACLFIAPCAFSQEYRHVG